MTIVKPLAITMEGSAVTQHAAVCEGRKRMSEAPTETRVGIPTCRRNTNPCVGPPATLPHEIPLPTAVENEIVRLHNQGHRGGTYDPSTCPICKATATHINTCPTCRATLTRCLRSEHCGAAWHPFAVLVAAVAKNVVRGLGWPSHTYSPGEVLDLATGKGLELILYDAHYDPAVALTDTGELTAYLYLPMRQELINFRRGNYAPDNPVPGNVNDDDGMDDDRLGPTDHTPSTDDLSGAQVREQLTVIGRIIVRYHDTLSTEAERFVFARWYTTRVDPTRAPIKVTQQKIADELHATTGTRKSQETISRWMEKFVLELAERAKDPDNGLTPQYRARFLNLIHGLYASSKTPPAPQRQDGDDTTPDTPLARPVGDDDNSPEGHND